MKKNILLWQMIIGIVICAIALISIFIPGIGLSSSKVANVMADWSLEQADKMTFGLASGLMSEEMQEEQRDLISSDLEEEMTEVMGADEVTYSVFQLLFKSADDFTSSHTEDAEEGNDSELIDTETVVNNTIFTKVQKYYNIFRVIFVIMLLLLIAILVFVLLAWFGKVSKWFPVIFTWVYAIVNIALWIVCYVVIPSRVEKTLVSGTDTILGGIDWLMGSDALGLGQITDWLDMDVAGVVRSIIWDMNYLGMYIWNIAVILLTIWSILCLCIKVQSFTADVSFSVPDISFATYSGTESGRLSYQGEPYAMQENSLNGYAAGVIHGINGSMAGAEIVLNQGEQIVVGRDPSVCELILADSKVSRKHCAISFNLETGMYDIFCFSRNGLRLSDGRKIAPMQPVSVQPGVRIILAGGNEVIALD